MAAFVYYGTGTGDPPAHSVTYSTEAPTGGWIGGPTYYDQPRKDPEIERMQKLIRSTKFIRRKYSDWRRLEMVKAGRVAWLHPGRPLRDGRGAWRVVRRPFSFKG